MTAECKRVKYDVSGPGRKHVSQKPTMNHSYKNDMRVTPSTFIYIYDIYKDYQNPSYSNQSFISEVDTDQQQNSRLDRDQQQNPTNGKRLILSSATDLMASLIASRCIYSQPLQQISDACTWRKAK